MYEVENGTDSVIVNCVYRHDRLNSLAINLFSECMKREDSILIQSWDISQADPNAIFEAFDVLISQTIPLFEKTFEDKMQSVMTEGAMTDVTTTRYERNPQARAACLAYHGYTCKVCGMNFEQTYGLEFKDIIEVHHIVPLSQIRHDYVVDPIRDLIPVCPNCHAAIHSKNGKTIKLR